jgi:hypothetical protein
MGKGAKLPKEAEWEVDVTTSRIAIPSLRDALSVSAKIRISNKNQLAL